MSRHRVLHLSLERLSRNDGAWVALALESCLPRTAGRHAWCQLHSTAVLVKACSGAHSVCSSQASAHDIIWLSSLVCSNHVWQVPPRDARYSDPSAMLEKTKGLNGAHVAKAPNLPNQGV